MGNVNFKQSTDFQKLVGKVYQEQKEKILKLIPSADVEHIGSTAIPGSVTKGDLDLNVRVTEEDFKSTVEQLRNLYRINQPENWTGTFASFKDDDNFELPVGIQLTVKGSEYDNFVSLRDLLINDPKLLEEYNQMKLRYEGKDLDEYRKVKAKFFERLRKLIH